MSTILSRTNDVTGLMFLVFLASFVTLIIAQDTRNAAAFFPFYGNGSSLEVESKIIDSTYHPDIIRGPSTFTSPQQSLPTNYYLPGNEEIPAFLQRTAFHHRAENVPYTYEYPNLIYPVTTHGTEHSIGTTSKQLIVVSFIGLLLLFAILQNTIATSTRHKQALEDMVSSRRRRNVHATQNFDSVTPEAVEILNDDARIRCIQRTICLENRKLFNDLGSTGKILAKYLTQSVKKSVESSSGWNRLVEDAGAAGMRDEDCDVLYRDCEFPIDKKKSNVVYRKESR